MARKRDGKAKGVVRATIEYRHSMMIVQPHMQLSPEEYDAISLKANTLGIKNQVVFTGRSERAFSVPNAYQEKIEELIKLFSPLPAMKTA